MNRTKQRILNALTGEIADDTITVEDLRMWEAMHDDMIGPLIRAREGIRRAIADMTDSPALPRPRYRTDTQQKLVLCPRCRRKYGTEEGAAVAAPSSGEAA